MLDPSVVEKISPDYWRACQLSIARFSSGCLINGVHYVLDPDTDFLVRHDIWKQEIKDAAKRKRVEAAEKKKWEAVTRSEQLNLLGVL